jgi:hypothetical protein
VEALYKAYKDKVQFFLIYTREIHPTRSKPSKEVLAKQAAGKYRAPRTVSQHESITDRVIAADACMKGLKMTIPTLLDDMKDTYKNTYAGMPAGTAVIDINGKIAYWNHGAPSGARPKSAEPVIKKLLAAGGGAIEKKWPPVRVYTDGPKKKTPTTKPVAKTKTK